MKILPVITACALYVLFSIAACFAGLTGLAGALISGSGSYLSHVSRSLDALLAAVFGWSGRKTVSTECGDQIVAGNPCRFCAVICAILEYKVLGRWVVLEVNHCRKNAS